MKFQERNILLEFKKALMMTDKKILIGFFLIIFLGASLRVYRFEEFLLFKADQARDGKLAVAVLEQGVGQLPLLGPKAGDNVVLEGDTEKGDTLQLGPAYYYIQYIPVLLFRSSEPWILALSDLLLSIFALGLAYWLFRQLFSQTVSLSLLAVAASSFFLIQYSRFAWNTNQIFFWEILLSLSLIKIAKEQDKLKAGWWLVLGSFSLAIITQLHFLGFFGYLTLTGTFLLIYKPQHIPKKFWFSAMGIFLLVYLPVILSDIANHGDNVKRFFAVIDQQEQSSSEPFLQKFNNTFSQHGKIYLLTLSSFTRQEVKAIPAIGVSFILLTIAGLVYYVWKSTLSWTELVKKNPLIVQFLIWFIVFFGLYLSISDKLVKTRYWLLSAIIPFIMLGLWFTLAEKYLHKKLSRYFIIAVAAILTIANLSAVVSFYDALDKGTENISGRNKLSYGVFVDFNTYGQMKRTLAWMAKKSSSKQKKMCYWAEDYQARKAYHYLVAHYYANIYQDEADKNCIFFVITKNKDGKSQLEKEYQENYSIVDSYRDKATAVYELTSPALSSKSINEDNSKIKADSVSNKALVWKDLY